MQRVTMIALTALGCTAAYLPCLAQQSAPPVTCYALTLGPWSSQTYGYTVPALVALDTVVVESPRSHDGRVRRRVNPDIVEGPSHRFDPRWSVDDGDTLRIDWSTGFSGFTLALGPEVAGERNGVVRAFWDVHLDPEPPPPRAKATARRAECGARAASALDTPAVATLKPPARIGRWVQTEHHDYASATEGVGYQYSDSSPTRLSVFIYQRTAEWRTHAARAALEHESDLFRQVLAYQRERGVDETYKIVSDVADSVVVGARVIPGHRIDYVFRQRGQEFASSQFFHAVGDDFIKVRLTMPGEEFAQTTALAIPEMIVTRTLTER